jgi:hypothetical protein
VACERFTGKAQAKAKAASKPFIKLVATFVQYEPPKTQATFATA